MACLLAAVASPAAADPPFDASVYVVPDMIRYYDPVHPYDLDFVAKVFTYAWDNAADDWVDTDYYRFDVRYSDGKSVHIDAMAAFGSTKDAQDIATIYADVLGQMPTILRNGVRRIAINVEGNGWSADDGEIWIGHADFLAEYDYGWIEESMFHETVHATLDPIYDKDPGWLAAREADADYISDYARDSGTTEDLAETFLMYYGLVTRPDRIDTATQQAILRAIPHRLEFLAAEFPPERLGN